MMPGIIEAELTNYVQAWFKIALSFGMKKFPLSLLFSFFKKTT
jgi:hypothetical protein